MSKVDCPALITVNPWRFQGRSRQVRVLARTLCVQLLLVGLFEVSRAGDSTGVVEPVGRIEVSETVFNLGYMPQHSILSHTFILKNVGEGILNIVNVKPTCACTNAPLEKPFLKPGEETALRVDFKSGNYNGKVHKRIKVLTNDPKEFLVELFITGVVAKLPESVELSGPALRFDKLDILKREVRIKNISHNELTLTVLPLSDEFLTATLTPAKIAPQQEALLVLELTGDTPLGEYKSSVTVEAKGKKIERFSVPITGIGYSR